ncbi:TPA: hypothetical protein EYP70_03245, partial [Candidatus Bathyarchaeota archaeon]|nr:hypothetical protein [Candidatus Bathyarchaeota archaeon]
MTCSIRDLDGILLPKRLYLDTVVVEEGICRSLIVCPKTKLYWRLAEKIVNKIKKCVGIQIPIVGDSDYSPEKYITSNALMLGNICVNRALIPLYHLYYVLVDENFPGKGGYVIRTVHDPWGKGINIIIIGGSDFEGVKQGVNVFLSLIRPSRTLILKKLSLIKLGEDFKRKYPHLASPPTDSDIRLYKRKAKEAMDSEAHGNLAPFIANAGFMYYRTGFEAYARLFKDLIYLWEGYSMRPITSTRKVFGKWGFDADFFLYKVISAWDLVEESPVFTEKDRLRITRILVDFIRDCIYHVGDVSRNVIRHNHSTFAALGLLFSGIYFSKFYHSKEAEEWLQIADQCFRPQAQAFKPYEDCNSYQWITLFHTLKHSLISSNTTFIDSGNANKASDYAILTMDNLGYQSPYGDVGRWHAGNAYLIPFLEGLTFTLKDPKYKWMLDLKEKVSSDSRRFEIEKNHYKCNLIGKEPKHLLGVVVFPLERKFFNIFKGESSTLYEKTFDKISFRSSFNPNDYYLLIDGTSCGGHAHLDGNAILRFTGKGRTFLDDGDYIKSYQKYHNSMLIMKEGISSSIPPFCELEHLADFEYTGFSQTSIKDYSCVDWFRTVVWRKKKFFLVIDRLSALNYGDYSFHCIWRILGETNRLREGICSEQKGVRFWLKMPPEYDVKIEHDHETGRNWQGYPYAEPIIKVIREVSNKVMRRGENHYFFNLLYIISDRDENYTITRVGSSAVSICGKGEKAYIGVGQETGSFKVRNVTPETSPFTDAAIFYISPSRFAIIDGTILHWKKRIFRSEKPISLEFDLRRGEGELFVPSDTIIMLYAGESRNEGVFIDGDLVEPTKLEGLLKFKVKRGRYKIKIANFSSGSFISTLSSDFDGANRPCRDKSAPSIHPLNKGLKVLWRLKNPACNKEFSAVVSGDVDDDGVAEVIVGSSDGWIYTLDAYGRDIWKFKTGGKVTSLWAGDVDKDGLLEIAAGSSDTKIYLIDCHGVEIWSRALEYHMRPGIVTTIFSYDLDGDGKDEIIVGSENWRYYAFDCEGNQKWFCETVRMSTVGCAADINGDGKGEVIAGTEYYLWHAIDSNGKILWSYRSGPGVNDVHVIDLDGDGKKEVIFGGRDAYVHVLS